MYLTLADFSFSSKTGVSYGHSSFKRLLGQAFYRERRTAPSFFLGGTKLAAALHCFTVHSRNILVMHF